MGRRGSVGAAEFKARCLELVDEVRETRAEYIVTRHGTPVARLAPIAAAGEVAFFGAMAGTVVQYDDPFAPVPGEWDVDPRPASRK